MTAPTTIYTDRALHAYLRRATWGLPTGRQQEVWDELEEHVLARANQLQVAGLSPAQALTQAIRELGPPGSVTLGMAKVYTMPKILIAAGTAALALSAALYAVAGGGAGPVTLPVLAAAPVKPTCVRGTVPAGKFASIVRQDNGVTCYTPALAVGHPGAFLSGRALVDALNTQGGQAFLRHNKTLVVGLPDGGGGEVNTRFTINGEPYFDAPMLISALDTSLPITLSGFNAPRVRIGQLDLQFGNGSIQVGQSFYNPLSGRLMAEIRNQPPGSSYVGGWFAANPGAPRHVVQTGQKPGEVVMLVTSKVGVGYTADTAPVLADGTVALQSAAKAVRFVSDPAQLGPYPSGGRINALLVRVSNIPLNQLRQGIFVPAQATSDAR